MESQRGSNMSKVTQLIVEAAWEQKELTRVHAPDRDATGCEYQSLLHLLRWQAESLPLSHLGSPCVYMHTR